MLTRLTSIRSAVLAFVCAIGLVLAVPTASAGDAVIDAAKAAGTVGERIDGYLGTTTPDADAAIQRKVNEINAKRRAHYERLASESGAPLEQVARLTGEKLVARAGSGEKVMTDNGRWTSK